MDNRDHRSQTIITMFCAMYIYTFLQNNYVAALPPAGLKSRDALNNVEGYHDTMPAGGLALASQCQAESGTSAAPSCLMSRLSQCCETGPYVKLAQAGVWCHQPPYICILMRFTTSWLVPVVASFIVSYNIGTGIV